MKPYIMGTMYGGNFKAKKSASSAAFADDYESSVDINAGDTTDDEPSVDIDDDDPIDAYEITFNGKMYYIDEDGVIYDIRREQPQPALMREFERDAPRNGKSFQTMLRDRSYLRYIELNYHFHQ